MNADTVRSNVEQNVRADQHDVRHAYSCMHPLSPATCHAPPLNTPNVHPQEPGIVPQVGKHDQFKITDRDLYIPLDISYASNGRVDTTSYEYKLSQYQPYIYDWPE
jgi:hypothetical protein